MRLLSLILVLGVVLLVPARSQKDNPFAGRWDINVTLGDSTSYPDWMELIEKADGPEVRVQPRGGSVHPAENVKIENSHLTFIFAPANSERSEVTWDLTVNGDRIYGVQKRGGQWNGQLAGVRAPELHREPPASWTAPESLFNGTDLTGWTPTSASATNNWVAQDGVLLNQKKGANLRTTRTFDDFKLHIEYNCPQDGNSGIYLRGRYEVQVEYEPVDANDRFHSVGSIYGFIAPSVDLPRKPATWETFDIMLVGRNVTVARNSITTIDNQEIPGITGGALDSEEGQPGPIYLQGDHTGGMMYRNITISLPKKPTR